jgi:hypothetical protein
MKLLTMIAKNLAGQVPLKKVQELVLQLLVVLEAFDNSRPAEKVVEEATTEGEGSSFVDWQEAGYKQYNFKWK